MIHLKKGLDIPIAGAPSLEVSVAPQPRSVALVGLDYLGIKPTVLLHEGDRVKIGQPLFEDKRNPGVVFTSPGSGIVDAVNRGARRILQSIVIDLDGYDAVSFEKFSGADISTLSSDAIRELLLESGQWTALRSRPFSKIPSPDTTPASVFVTATDTNPLAPDPHRFLGEYLEEFNAGLQVLHGLVGSPIHLCVENQDKLPAIDLPDLRIEEFQGPHPAGLPGTHIHFLDPVGPSKTVWYIGYQDVAAWGHLFLKGEILLDRIISLAGPQIKKPRLLKTRLGASLDDLVAGELVDGECRVISGSVLSGRTSQGPLAYLGRYHQQVSVIEEGRQQEFLGWLAPGMKKYGFKSVFLSKLFKGREFGMNSSLNGSRRAIVPTGSFEQVMPLDIEATFLLRSLAVRDCDQAQALGCLELDEEDIALLTFVDSSKNDFGPMLRETLNIIEKEG